MDGHAGTEGQVGHDGTVKTGHSGHIMGCTVVVAVGRRKATNRAMTATVRAMAPRMIDTRMRPSW